MNDDLDCARGILTVIVICVGLSALLLLVLA